MSDFILDFSRQREAGAQKAAQRVRYIDNIKVALISRDLFTLTISRADDWKLWSPYTAESGSFVALCGRVALEPPQWEWAGRHCGPQGMACCAIYEMYAGGGIDALKELNGNFLVVVFDAPGRKLHVITDQCGMFSCYRTLSPDGRDIVGTNADLMAELAGKQEQWDLASLAEFIISGQVMFPNTMYRGISMLPMASITTFSCSGESAGVASSQGYHTFDFNLDHRVSEWDLAQELADAFRMSITRRVLPCFGRSAIALSGGMDSRAFLCAASNPQDLYAFTFYDEKNYELDIAAKIARAMGSLHVPLKRGKDFYGENARNAVRIAGGPGNVFANPYLGFMEVFRLLGINNILNGLYCDTLFKGFSLDATKNKFTRKKSFKPFFLECGESYFWADTPLCKEAGERFRDQFPDTLRSDLSDEGRLRIEARRIFPLIKDSDSLMVLIPERTMGCFHPIVDNAIIDVYCRTPPHYKLNGTLFAKTLQLLCPKNVRDIAIANTGARVTDSYFLTVQKTYLRILMRKFRKRKIATDESWPNWSSYIRRSPAVGSIWATKNPEINRIFSDILGKKFSTSIADYSGPRFRLFFRLFTLKTWMEAIMNASETHWGKTPWSNVS